MSEKSSLINKLCNRKSLARSAPRRQNGDNQLLYGGFSLFLDLPGYGYAKVAQAERQRWDRLINTYFEQARKNALLDSAAGQSACSIRR